MTITYELDLNSFEAWSGAKETLERIQREGKCEELENVLEELYPDGMTETELNDLLWFDSESVYEWLGIRSESQIKEEIEESANIEIKVMPYFITAFISMFLLIEPALMVSVIFFKISGETIATITEPTSRNKERKKGT